MRRGKRLHRTALTVVIIGALAFLLFANIAYVLSGKNDAPGRAPSSFHSPQPVTIEPATHSATADEAPQPTSELAAAQEGAYYLSEWASLSMAGSLEPNLFLTPVPDNPGGDATPIDATALIGSPSLFPVATPAAPPGGNAINIYPLPPGFHADSGFPSGPPPYPGGNPTTTFFPSIPYRYRRPSNNGDDSTNNFLRTVASTFSSPPNNNTSDDNALLPLDAPLNSVFLGAGGAGLELDAECNETACPEPTTSLLLTCALASTLLLRRMKRRNS